MRNFVLGVLVGGAVLVSALAVTEIRAATVDAVQLLATHEMLHELAEAHRKMAETWAMVAEQQPTPREEIIPKSLQNIHECLGTLTDVVGQLVQHHEGR